MGTVESTKKNVPNDLNLQGIEFVEFSAQDRNKLAKLFSEFGFSKTHQDPKRSIEYFVQNDIQFLLNSDKSTRGFDFSLKHGPSISAMGWRFLDADKAYKLALERGAKAADRSDYRTPAGKSIPAILGIGDSLIYFIDRKSEKHLPTQLSLIKSEKPEMVPSKGFQEIDHLTNNVYLGTMTDWANFYKNIFGFYEVRYFDIKGQKTGLQSYALKDPSGTFSIPINEAKEKKSQINEYLDEYKGPGVQHLAFATPDIVKSIQQLEKTSIETLDILPEYYQQVFNRVPNVKEDKKEIERLNILVDGDAEGYLLQIFTKNLIGPIFIEIIQRRNHHAFGEGNFQALFDSIERDQERRGYLK